MNRRITIIAVVVALAIISFAYARHHYMTKNSTTLTNPFNAGEKANVTNPFVDQKLFGDWMKEEKLFAIIVPVILLAGGAVLAAKR